MLTLLIILIFLMLLFATSYPQWRRRITYQRWHKSLLLSNHLATFQKLFSEIDGFHLSRQARTPRDAIEYTYGEIDFISFIALLSMTHPNSSTVFYDLGSGSGKAVLACAMVYNIKKSIGIECLHLLYQAALTRRDKLQQLSNYKDKAQTIDFIYGDFLEIDLHEATLIFINATSFFGQTWVAINEHLSQVNPGTVIITTSKSLSNPSFALSKKTKVQMSWGVVHAYIHERLPEGE